MLFVESRAFENARRAYLDDEGLRELQAELIINPKAGAVVPGTGGVRKLRWGMAGRGKRGGLRVIYYVVSSRFRCHLLHLYPKSVQDDLTPEMKKTLATLVRRIEEGE